MTFEGVYSVLPTPFTDRGDLDEASLRRVVDLFIEKGVNGLTALGVTGEVGRLEEPERARVLEVVVGQTAGRVPIVAGTSAEGTRTCVAYSRQAKALGAAAVMVSPPRMPKLNSEAVVRHYKALAEALDAPIVVQDYPPISGFAMEPALLARIAREIPSARTIKLEDPPTPFKTARILEQAAGRAGPDLRRARRRVPARGADVRRDGGDDRFRLSGNSRADRAAVPRRPDRRRRRPVLPRPCR